MYGIRSASCAAHRRSSQSSRTCTFAGTPAMIGTNSEIAWFTAVPIAPDELSTRSRAGERRSRKVTAPSAASTGSRRATFFISLTASFTRWMAGWDLQPNEERRKRALNSHAWPSALAMVMASYLTTRGHVITWAIGTPASPGRRSATMRSAAMRLASSRPSPPAASRTRPWTMLRSQPVLGQTLLSRGRDGVAQLAKRSPEGGLAGTRDREVAVPGREAEGSGGGIDEHQGDQCRDV